MKKPRKYLLRIILSIVGLVILYLGGVILYGTVTDFEPEEQIPVVAEGADGLSAVPDTLDLLIWNIGYAGLGKDMDFFYDGGDHVEPEEDWFADYLKGIKDYLSGHQETDFVLLQEVDRNSARSYHKDELVELEGVLTAHSAAYAVNYQVEFVPLPLTDPLGEVNAGLATFSLYHPSDVKRNSFPGNYGWPKSVFMLDRCFMTHRFPAKDGKELIIINTHNSAYDDGTLKSAQMEYLRTFLLAEYEKGNYIVVGGDWNQAPPNFNPLILNPGIDRMEATAAIPMEYLPPEWTWAYDPLVATNRSLATPLDPHLTRRGLIDFFLISPNIQLKRVEGVNLGFEDSDHNPVKAQIILK